MQQWPDFIRWRGEWRLKLSGADIYAHRRKPVLRCYAPFSICSTRSVTQGFRGQLTILHLDMAML